MAWLICTATLANASSTWVRSSGSSDSASRISRMQPPTAATATARVPTIRDLSRRSVRARRSARTRRSSPAGRRAIRRRSVSIGSVRWRRSSRRRSPARRPIVPRRLVTRRSRAFIIGLSASSRFTVSVLLATRLGEPGRAPADRCGRSGRLAKPRTCVCAARGVPAAWSAGSSATGPRGAVASTLTHRVDVTSGHHLRGIRERPTLAGRRSPPGSEPP
jgi:hypothetical protein